ncbi:hypothetical protein PFLG_03129 [Plasmodium falciparum RAJ116]|uniref:Uncharacterized protein n=1 Tax=Plasmodium falciparum RAJ116 TaxID=580058 RepID=A0A0L0D140_PLAFA|nr:hypothetical protein PFLG_03129 [Plasmodium falciparum RAJ116]
MNILYDIMNICQENNILYKILNDEYIILNETYDEICHVTYSFGIMCYVFGFYKFFKIENLKIIKNNNICSYNLFQWVYDIKYTIVKYYSYLSNDPKNIKIFEDNINIIDDKNRKNNISTDHFNNMNAYVNILDHHEHFLNYIIFYYICNLKKVCNKWLCLRNNFFYIFNEYIEESFKNYMIIKNTEMQEIFSISSSSGDTKEKRNIYNVESLSNV